jgi:dTDP-4-dehydrorhamnose reductase
MLGRALCRCLSREHAVIAATKEEFDITDEAATRRAIRAAQPEAVIHAAAFTRVDDAEAQRETAFAVNARGTRHVAQGCEDAGARLIYISTDYVFDGKKGRPYVETDPPHPLGVYGASKLEGERETSRLGARSLIVRAAWLFGPGGPNFVRTIFTRAGEGGALRVVDDQVGGPTYTVDLAEAIARLLSVGAGGIVHSANGGHCTWFQFARAILEEADLKGVSITPISTDVLRRPAPRPTYSVLDTARYASLTGHTLRPWRDALREYLAVEGWLKSPRSEVQGPRSEC